jgi:hypothetical protein
MVTQKPSGEGGLSPGEDDMSEHAGGRTELADLQREIRLPDGWFTFERDARLFGRDQARLQRLESQRKTVPLAPDQLFHPSVPVDAVVRKGKLRISEFLADGREVTRAVLQAGAVFRTRQIAASAPLGQQEGAAGVFHLADIVLTSLGEGELWLLPASTLDAEMP